MPIGEYLPALIGGGLGVAGALINSNQAGKANEATQQQSQNMYDLARQEQARRDAMTKMFLPSVMRDMGASNPIGAAQQAYPAQPQQSYAPPQMAQAQGAQQPKQGGGIGSTLANVGMSVGIPMAAKALGGAGGGAIGGAVGNAMGLGGGSGLLGLGAVTIPVVGGLIGGAILASKLIGRGREQADILTNPGGMQNAFEQTLTQIDSMGLPEAEAWKQKEDAYATLVEVGMQHAQQGDRQKLVVTQMFNTISPLFGKPNPMTGGM